jgi:hypothetical protein
LGANKHLFIYQQDATILRLIELCYVLGLSISASWDDLEKHSHLHLKLFLGGTYENEECGSLYHFLPRRLEDKANL